MADRTIEEWWDLVNGASSHEDVARIYEELIHSELSIEDADELLVTLSMVSRDLYRKA